ncbi:LysM peptidoglycan-binding domain-containing protein [Pseudoxanthobacter sp. M-2]|uniref:LysM peptidoglycan-binding domain-containing protein n=1 Tax=Pseudoxanthobacter sp. M-2 TaxID=3078754 RepID=UPI0038FC0406
MGTSRRLLGIVLLLVVVGGGGYLLYGEHQRQTAEREAAATAPAAEAPSATAESAPAASTSDTSSSAASPADALSAPATPATEGAADTAATAGSSASTSATGTGSTPADTAADGAAPAGTAASNDTAPAPPATAAAPETISQPEPVVPTVAGEAAPPTGAPTFDVVRVEPGGDAVMAGRSEPGMVIALFANGKEIGRTRANDSGEWVITLEEPLGPGEYVVTIVGATPDGSRQVESVDRIAVSIPQGKSEPPMVALMSPDAPTKVLQQPEAPAAVAAASGAPAAATADAASGGSAAPAATAGAVAGAAPAAVAAAPGSAAPPPTWAQPFATGGNAATSQAAAPSQPAATASQPAPAEPAVAAAPETPAAAALAVGMVEKDGDTVTVTGASLPGATVRLYVNDAPVGEAVADAAGRWTFTGPHTVGPGDHTVRADQVDPATGTVMARSAVPFEVLSAAEIADAPATPETPAVVLPPPTVAETAMIAAAPEPAAPAAAAGTTAARADAAAGAGMRKIRIRKGDDLWTLAERYYGKRRGVRYTAIYRANRKQIRNPDLIYPGQVFVIPR